MRAISEMEVIQIDITNACHSTCSNCTRFCGHHKKPFFMDLPTFRRAVDSLVDFPGMVGVIGGEPLLHPEFAAMAEYLRDRIPDKKRRGLWTTVPRHRTRHADLIRDVFGHMNLNDHSIDRILHQPILVAAEEIIPDERERWQLIEKCWVQLLWSASITPKGAFFCEVAAAMSHLFDGSPGWPVEPGWWKRTPRDFKAQKEEYCPKCGCAVPLKRRRSTEEIDDVSPKNRERLIQLGSPKAKRGKLQVYQGGVEKNWQSTANWYMSELSVADEREFRMRSGKRLGIEDLEKTNQFRHLPLRPVPFQTNAPAASPSQTHHQSSLTRAAPGHHRKQGRVAALLKRGR